MKVLIGLGNPGAAYEQTRHNVGFMVVEALGRAHGVQLRQELAEAQRGRVVARYGEYTARHGPVRLLQPLTMMNASGDVLRTWRQPPERLLVVCDDVNLPLGTIRLRAHGSDGGHLGVASCIEALGTEAVARLRVGVGGVALPRDLEDYVLAPFAPAEQSRARDAVRRAAQAAETWVDEGIEVAMNRHNTKVLDG